MALNIRRGASRVFYITLENCEAQDFIWRDLGTIRVRLSQGNVVVDKIAEIDHNDETACFVYFSQEDTIKFSDKFKAKVQVFILRESTDHQLAVKSTPFDVVVMESLWDEVITDGVYSGIEDFSLVDPAFQEPIGHDYYGYLHIDISEFRGIISEVDEALIEGDTLVYDPSSETLSSTSS